jgi:phage tail protein X
MMWLIAVMSCGGGIGANVVSISYVCPPVTLSWHVVPEHAPLKPEKLYPEPAVADNVSPVPSLKLAVQVPGQSIPAGLLITVPLPDIATVTCAGGIALKVAETEVSLDKTRRHEEPLQAPPKLLNMYPETGVAVRDTAVPERNDALQVAGQLIPAGVLVNVPLPEIVTVSRTCFFSCVWGSFDPPPPQPERRKNIAARSGN